jgi:hypothetical protein
MKTKNIHTHAQTSTQKHTANTDVNPIPALHSLKTTLSNADTHTHYLQHARGQSGSDGSVLMTRNKFGFHDPQTCCHTSALLACEPLVATPPYPYAYAYLIIYMRLST